MHPASGDEDVPSIMDDIFESAKEAGRQLVANGRMSAEALRTVARELMPRDT